jgi:hypothetical protein
MDEHNLHRTAVSHAYRARSFRRGKSERVDGVNFEYQGKLFSSILYVKNENLDMYNLS